MRKLKPLNWVKIGVNMHKATPPVGFNFTIERFDRNYVINERHFSDWLMYNVHTVKGPFKLTLTSLTEVCSECGGITEAKNPSRLVLEFRTLEKAKAAWFRFYEDTFLMLVGSSIHMAIDPPSKDGAPFKGRIKVGADNDLYAPYAWVTVIQDQHRNYVEKYLITEKENIVKSFYETVNPVTKKA